MTFLYFIGSYCINQPVIPSLAYLWLASQDVSIQGMSSYGKSMNEAWKYSAAKRKMYIVQDRAVRQFFTQEGEKSWKAGMILNSEYFLVGGWLATSAGREWRYAAHESQRGGHLTITTTIFQRHHHHHHCHRHHHQCVDICRPQK